jgi:hypothetical protein
LIDDPLILVHAGVAERAVSCDGKVSVRSNVVDVLSPVLVTTIWYVTISPDALGLLLTRRLLMSRSAPVEITLHDADPALLPEKNSKELVLPVAVFTPVVPTVTHGAICPVMIRLMPEPAGRSGIKNTRFHTVGLVAAMDDVRYWS